MVFNQNQVHTSEKGGGGKETASSVIIHHFKSPSYAISIYGLALLPPYRALILQDTLLPSLN